jgi:hypothetical protein
VQAALDQVAELLKSLGVVTEPQWVRDVKLLALPGCLIGSVALGIWALQAYDHALPKSKLALAVLTVSWMAGVGLGAGLMFFLLGALLGRFAGGKPVPLSVAGYALLSGFCFGVACSVAVFWRV